MKMFAEFQQVAKEIFDSAAKENRLVRNPDNEQLRAFALAKPDVRVTKYGSSGGRLRTDVAAAAMHEEQHRYRLRRSRTRTTRAGQRVARPAKRLVSIDVTVGDGSEGITARLIVPKAFAHVAYGGLEAVQARP